MYFVRYNDGWIILRKTFYISNITNILTLYINAMKHDHNLYVNGRKEYEYYDVSKSKILPSQYYQDLI